MHACFPCSTATLVRRIWRAAALHTTTTTTTTTTIVSTASPAALYVLCASRRPYHGQRGWLRTTPLLHASTAKKTSARTKVRSPRARKAKSNPAASKAGVSSSLAAAAQASPAHRPPPPPPPQSPQSVALLTQASSPSVTWSPSDSAPAPPVRAAVPSPSTGRRTPQQQQRVLTPRNVIREWRALRQQCRQRVLLQTTTTTTAITSATHGSGLSGAAPSSSVMASGGAAGGGADAAFRVSSLGAEVSPAERTQLLTTLAKEAKT